MNGHRQTVFVTGCFDLLHAGHVAFLEQAASYGNLTVAIGSDRTVSQLKGQPAHMTEAERLYLVSALRCVKHAFISQGTGILDFESEFREIRPNVFIVNEDGDHERKRKLCEEMRTQYVVLQRKPANHLPARSTTSLAKSLGIPHRLELSGGWLDQPFVSRLASGDVIVTSVWPHFPVSDRSGLATSSHKTAQRLWGNRLPFGDPVELARVLFACENPPGTTEVAGSQDALGIVLPGVNRLHYSGAYWPSSIEPDCDTATARWLESVLKLVPLGPRPDGFRVREVERITPEAAMKLAEASLMSWQAIEEKNLTLFGKSLTQCLHAQNELFPATISPAVAAAIEALPQSAIGCKMTGAGGGGFLIVVSEEPVPGAVRFSIRVSSD